MPTNDGDRSRTAVSDDLVFLLEQHKQLREEVDRLQKERQNLKEEKPKEERKEPEKSPPAKPPLRQRAAGWVRTHPVAAVLMTIGAVVLVVAGVVFWRYLQSYESTNDAQIDGHINAVGSRISGTSSRCIRRTIEASRRGTYWRNWTHARVFRNKPDRMIRRWRLTRFCAVHGRARGRGR